MARKWARSSHPRLGGGSLRWTARPVGVIHVWAYPNPGSNAPAMFLGVADYGLYRGDVALAFGDQTGASGFDLTVRGLPAGVYQVVAFAYSTVTGSFNQARAATVTVAPDPYLAIDTPTAALGSLTLPATIVGWVLDAASEGETGIDAVHVWAYPAGGGPALFAGAALYGQSRPDVATAFGNPSYEHSGYSLALRDLPPGNYMLAVFARRTGMASFDIVNTVDIEVAASTSAESGQSRR